MKQRRTGMITRRSTFRSTLAHRLGFALGLALVACKAAPLPGAGVPSAPDGVSPSRPAPLFSDEAFESALARARAEKKLLFVDAWAPWCHTCLSMQSEVLEEPEVRAFADRVVFVALDTDRPENAAFLERYAVRVWPTFYAIDPETAAPIAAYGGALSKAETTRFLQTALDAKRAIAAGGAGQAKALAEAHTRFAAREFVDAEQWYRAALAEGGARDGEAYLGVIRCRERFDVSACVDFGRARMLAVEGAATPIDFVSYTLACAEKLPEGDDTKARREEIWGMARSRLRALAKVTRSGASVDDRADAYALLADVEEASGNGAAAMRAHQERLELLLDAVKRAPSVEAARVHDYARMVSYLYLGRGDEAVAMYEERTRQFPGDYEPWARLASTLHEIRREEEALRAVDETLALAYGPRALRYMTLRADILDALGRGADAITTAEKASATCAAMPKGHRDPERCAELEKDLAARRARAAPAAP